MSIDARLEELDLQLPTPFPPVGTYVNAVRTGDLVVLGGTVSAVCDGDSVCGKLGEDLDVKDGRRAARLAALNALATLRAELGSLDRVARIVSVRGFVNAAPTFTEHTRVVDSASDLFVAVFGDRGRHARIAFGVSSLPANLALEIELLAEVAE